MNTHPNLRAGQLLIVASIGWLLAVSCQLTAQETEPVTDKLLPTGRLIEPVGDSLMLSGRPVDLKLGHRGKLLFVKDRNHLRVIDVSDGNFELKQSVACPGGASLYGIAVSQSGKVYVTNAKHQLHVYNVEGETYLLENTIELPKDSFPCGIKLIRDEGFAAICLSKKNQLAIVDLKTEQVEKLINVGIAPFDVSISNDGKKAIVTNIGGRRPTKNDQTAPSAGTETVVDERGVANTGTVSIINLDDGTVEKHVSVGLHPSAVCRTGDSFLICNSNADTLTRLDANDWSTKEVVVKPDDSLPFGSMPSSVLAAPNREMLFVTLAGNNAIAVLPEWSDVSQAPKLKGLIPTGWFPAAMACSDDYLYVANIKGNGARTVRRAKEKGRNSHDHQGTVQRIPLKQIREQLNAMTATATKNSRVPQILRSTMLAKSSSTEKRLPIPKRLGDPSLFEHVIYVIKENRTFDQVFGDVEEARSDPSLCVFPEKVTPNHHALAQQFGLLDNYYCNGVLSADGHSWATEGNVTPYLERAFGGFARSYTFGDDPITYSSSGFLWDQILAAGLSFRNYGEMDYAKPPEGMKYQEIWKAYQAGEEIDFYQKIGIERLRRYACRDYPGWNMMIPDVLRMDRFLKEFREFEKNGGLPNLSIVYLPQDHLGGGVTSNAHMADNDLAVGRLVDAVSHSTFWKKTLIVINEDDPQNGYDHIDGHRSLCLVISPYSRKGVNHSFYNQSSVLRTILHIFGIPPMNQQVASAPLMRDCFETDVVQQPYSVRKANYALNESPKPKEKQSSVEQRWRRILATVPIERTGMKTPKDEDNLNRFVWHETMGWETPYPVEKSGAHATGLKKLGLKVDASLDD
ncbi:MAG: alkaline phosphatase family protein [Planctomycetota bacterium]